MKTSNNNHMPWCTDHRGDLCRSKTWTVASIRLCLFGCSTDVPPVHADVEMPAPAQGLAYSLAVLSRLSDALRALTMLGHQVDSRDADYWVGRLDTIEERDEAELSS